MRELSGSDSNDKLNGEISEGWNPLSPLSIDCEFEAERLITSRCGSHASSSLRTVDSLTNVTRMTVSSLDLSNSSKTTDSISSVSSVQSSLSSTSSDEVEDTQDYDQQWNVLWKNHYEEEYVKNYQQFLSSHRQQDDNFSLDLDKQILIKNKTKENVEEEVEIKKLHQKIVGDKLKQLTVGKVSSMFNNLQMDDDGSSSYDENIEQEQMSSLGLPIAFGISKVTLNQNNAKKAIKK